MTSTTRPGRPGDRLRPPRGPRAADVGGPGTSTSSTARRRGATACDHLGDPRRAARAHTRDPRAVGRHARHDGGRLARAARRPRGRAAPAPAGRARRPAPGRGRDERGAFPPKAPPLASGATARRPARTTRRRARGTRARPRSCAASPPSRPAGGPSGGGASTVVRRPCTLPAAAGPRPATHPPPSRPRRRARPPGRRPGPCRRRTRRGRGPPRARPAAAIGPRSARRLAAARSRRPSPGGRHLAAACRHRLPVEDRAPAGAAAQVGERGPARPRRGRRPVRPWRRRPSSRTTIPGVQNPHWLAPVAQNASAHGRPLGGRGRRAW